MADILGEMRDVNAQKADLDVLLLWCIIVQHSRQVCWGLNSLVYHNLGIETDMQVSN